MERATPLRRYDTWSAPAPEDLEAAVEGVPYLTEVSNNHYIRPSGPDSKSTAVETQATRPPSELKSWRRFIPNLGRETEDGPKHEPFTLKNQLAATIFNHWVRALLLLTPIGFSGPLRPLQFHDRLPSELLRCAPSDGHVWPSTCRVQNVVAGSQNGVDSLCSFWVCRPDLLISTQVQLANDSPAI